MSKLTLATILAVVSFNTTNAAEYIYSPEALQVAKANSIGVDETVTMGFLFDFSFGLTRRIVEDLEKTIEEQNVIIQDHRKAIEDLQDFVANLYAEQRQFAIGVAKR